MIYVKYTLILINILLLGAVIYYLQIAVSTQQQILDKLTLIEENTGVLNGLYLQLEE